MKVALIAVSRDGLEQAARLKAIYPGAAIYAPPRLVGLLTPGQGAESPGPLEINPLEGGFSVAVGELFKTCRLLIFISAVAVAVRAVGPFLQGKDVDPAVVVVDEQGRYAISLLSGHLGGANEQCAIIAGALGAEAVITTATDIRGITAFDDLARSYNWQIENLADLKSISAALLEEREVALYCEEPVDLPLKGRIRIVSDLDALREPFAGRVIISSRADIIPGDLLKPWIILRPRHIYAGIGCRRGVVASAVIGALKRAFEEAGLEPSCLAAIASGEFKADEPGLIQAARELGQPFIIFSRDQIASAVGDSAVSDFVESQVGVGAVAEPCARLASGGGKIVLPTQRGDGITVALASGPIAPAGGA